MTKVEGQEVEMGHDVENEDLATENAEIVDGASIDNDDKNMSKKKKKDSKEVIEKTDAEIAAENLAGWQRCQADFDNYKKRQVEAQKELAQYAGQNMLNELLPVMDNFHMATAHVPADQKDSPWLTGIMYIQQQLDKVLEDNGMVEIRVEIGDDFDAEIMEAVTEQVQTAQTNTSAKSENLTESESENEYDKDESGENVEGDEESATETAQSEKTQKVQKIITKGYKVGQKIIRPTRVVVE